MAKDLLQTGARFDVILCDLMLDEMTGMALYRELEETRPELAQRMIFMTGGAFTPRAQGFLARVTNRVLEKPFSPDDLLALLRVTLHRRKVTAA